MHFLTAGLKYHDTRVRTRSNNDGINELRESPTARCEKIAPDMAKKKPAYAHSFRIGDFGISTAATPRIFQTPRIVRR
jgi:hypothetical protein